MRNVSPVVLQHLTDLESREWLKSFVLMLAMIVLTLALAAELSSLVNNASVRV